MSRSLKRLAVFASGEGTNLQALIDATRSLRIRGEIALVVSSQPEAGALRRAQRAGLETLVCSPKDFASPEEFNAHLAHACKSRDVDLICLAGFMILLKKPLLDAFPGRIMNIHPALLPSFGGKGMYGRHVHEAVLQAGAKVSGCTVHFVDEHYDHGRIISQSAVPVLAGDTPETLAARVRAQEHWLYPRAAALFCENRLTIGEDGVRILPSPIATSSRIKRALLSTADKTGLVEFAKGLTDMGVEIVSTSGTAKMLVEAGIPPRSLESLTGFPEILAGRVKTLHPHIHGGILLRRQDPSQTKEAALLGLEPIDLVAVNLYPFAQAVAKSSSPYSQEVIENIDIGGVALIRAAAKNFEDVAVLVSPADYPGVLRELENSQCQLSPETRRRLALGAFQHTASYDAMIAGAWKSPSTAVSEGFPETIELKLTKVQDLRYGENPHQKAARYVRKDSRNFEQIHGKELSYNNLLDAHAAWEAVCEFTEPAAVVFKHVTPCGIAVGHDILEAFLKAWACDPLSAFGGILSLNRPMTLEIATELAERFIEVVVCPSYDAEALTLLRKKPNLRLLVRQEPPSKLPVLRSLDLEVLVTEPDHLAFDGELKIATKRRPSPEETKALRFAWVACKHVRSNAIVLAGPGSTVGIGAGQMSRVDAVHMAGLKYMKFLKENPKPPVLVMASDAFFPFPDSIEAAAGMGVTAVIEPGGSIKDPEVIAAADANKLAMVFTGLRHFKH